MIIYLKVVNSSNLMGITCTLNQLVSIVLYLNVYFISVLYLTSIYISLVLYMRRSRKFFQGGSKGKLSLPGGGGGGGGSEAFFWQFLKINVI